MSFIQRIAARFVLSCRFEELYEDEFESFFHDLMCVRYPDFVDVRTAGSLGDLGSDGLSLHTGKLYACYGPRIFKEDKIRKKFRSDLDKARAKRGKDFKKFVFVLNDRRGTHPVMSSIMAQAAVEFPTIEFDHFGFRKFRDEALRLDLEQFEDLLGQEIPVQEMTYGNGLEELEPLLAHLNQHRRRHPPPELIEIPSRDKIEYNDFDEDTRDELIRHLHLGSVIDNYYAGRVDVTERDEVAAGFREEYLRLRSEFDDVEMIILRLQDYILGNASQPWSRQNAAKGVLAYLFQTCDIFENPPSDWSSPVRAEVST